MDENETENSKRKCIPCGGVEEERRKLAEFNQRCARGFLQRLAAEAQRDCRPDLP